MNYTPEEWGQPLTSAGGQPWDGKFFIDWAQEMERACFDYIMIEDTLMISDAYGGQTKAYLKQAIMGHRHDPVILPGS